MRVLKKTDGVTAFNALPGKRFSIVFIMVMMMVSTSRGLRDTRPPRPSAASLTPVTTQIDALYQNIRQRVTDMEYTEGVAQDLVAMTRQWRTPSGLPVLPVLERILLRAQEAYRTGQISTMQLAKPEEKVVAGLCQSIKGHISYRRDYFDLTTIIEVKSGKEKESHHVQLWLYMMSYEARRIKGEIRYCNVKYTYTMDELPPNLWDYVYYRVRPLLTSKLLPPVKGSHCRYCGYKKYCQKEVITR